MQAAHHGLIAIHQPNYLPWPGFFHKWFISDAFVLLDTVQFHKNEWQNRNQIKSAHGVQWLTVPVTYRFPQTIDNVGIHASPWARKQCAAIEQAYRKTPFFELYWFELRELLLGDWQLLSQLNIAIIRWLGEKLQCKQPLHIASEFDVQAEDPTKRLIAICQTLGGDAYLSGVEGKNYLEDSSFSDVGINLYFQKVEAPVYAQLHGDFISHLSVVDMLFNVGAAQSIVLIEQMGGKES
ncbi:MAG: WbqC family protein [Mariprofundaceae bacterium]